MKETPTDLRGKVTDENYLKNILLLQMRHGVATAADLERALSCTTSTVYSNVNRLAAEGYLVVRKGARGRKPSIELSTKGKPIAERTLHRHQMIQKWLMQLGIGQEEAGVQACALEHALHERTLGLIRKHVEMARRFIGNDAPSAETMRMIASGMKRHDTAQAGMTEVDEMMHAVAQNGGYQTLLQHSQLIGMLGGADNVRKVFQVVGDLGGLDAIIQQDQEVTALGGMYEISRVMNKIEKHGGIGSVMEVERAILRLGGTRKIQAAVDLNDKYGDPKLLKAKLEVLEQLERFGEPKEIKRMLEQLEQLGGVDGMKALLKLVTQISKFMDNLPTKEGVET